MGNNFICCQRTENINNIIKHNDELSNKDESIDYLKLDDKNNNPINNDIELMIETELPLDFHYNLSLNNNLIQFLTFYLKIYMTMKISKNYLPMKIRKPKNK